MTARQLREEETEVFKQSVSSESPDYHLHVRDYHRLCRGEKIVSKYDYSQVPIKQVYSIIILRLFSHPTRTFSTLLD